MLGSLAAVSVVIALLFAVPALTEEQSGHAADVSRSPFQDAVSTCLSGTEDDDYASIGDSGHTLTLNGAGNIGRGLDASAHSCVLDSLHLPDSVRAKIGQTHALDGQQTATWDDIEASWTYHPDAGLDVVLTRAR